jgi:hypothetical protein
VASWQIADEIEFALNENEDIDIRQIINEIALMPHPNNIDEAIAEHGYKRVMEVLSFAAVRSIQALRIRQAPYEEYSILVGNINLLISDVVDRHKPRRN